HAVFGRAERRRADALAWRQERKSEVAGLETLADGPPKTDAEVAEITRLALVHVFADAARDHRAGDPSNDTQRFCEPQALDLRRRRTLGECRDERIRHPVRDSFDLLVGHLRAECPI